jgi:hypothetical protein
MALQIRRDIGHLKKLKTKRDAPLDLYLSISVIKITRHLQYFSNQLAFGFNENL